MSDNKLPDLNQGEHKLARTMQDNEADDNLIRLSTGVILAAHLANPNLIIKALSRFSPPEPPEVFMEAMGRYMQNTADPDYALKMRSWQMQYANAMNNVFVSYGTTLKSKPKGLPGPDDDEWLQQLYAMDMPVLKDNRYWRYLNWVLTVAAPLETDTRLIQEKVGRLSGVREEDVNAAATFPGSDKNS